MPPAKKSPPRQSDESLSDDEPVKKSKKKTHKPINTKKTDEPEKEKAPQARPNLNDSIQDDEEEDLINLVVPEKPQCFTSENPNGERLMIVKIEVHNFKSYYGSSEIGPFHKSFSSIIGPNGSGKSNVIDSLLFVFGFRSGKIRSKKISNLIHSSAGKKCDSCSVSIHFQKIIDIDENHYKIVRGSQFAISRTGYQNNSSTYAIDGKNVPLKEVEARLKKVEIDLTHNRFLILQGEVEAISMMKPKGTNHHEEGMLEYLEDIIGSNRFATPLIKFEKRIARLSVEVSQQRLRQETARTNKSGLEPDVREAIEFLSKENDINILKGKLEQRRKLKYTDQLEPLQEELTTKKEEMKVVAEKLDENKQGSKDNEKMDKELMKAKSEAEAEFDKAKQEIEDDATEEKKRKQNLKRLGSDVEKMTAEMEKEIKKKESLVEAPAKATKKIEKLKTESEDLKEIEKSANEKADENLAIFDARSEEYQEAKTAAENDFAKENEILNEKKGKASIAEAELQDLKKMAEKGKNTVADLKAKLEEAEKKAEAEEEELLEIAPKLEENQKLFNDASREGPAARAKEQQLDREIREIRSRMNEMAHEQQRHMTGSQSLQALMREKNEGRLPGFLGRLGDLGAIDSKYDVAISTNCGMLNSYVCETADSAAKAIDFLCAKRLGRANFISLDKLQTNFNRMNQRPDAFPVPRLFDLVKCESVAKPAFYFALGDLLVVKDLGEAQQLDRAHNHKYVFCTLEGGKLSNDGSITGGGQPQRGLIGSELKTQRKSTANADEMRKLQQECEELQEQYKQWAPKAKFLDEQVYHLRGEVKKLSDRHQMLKIAVDQNKTKIETLKKTIEVQEVEARKVKVDPKEIEEKKAICEKLVQERDEADRNASNARKIVDEVTSKVDAMFKELVECHRKEAKDARDKRLAIEKTIAKETGAINNSERNIAKCDERIAQLDKDLAKRQNDIEKLEENQVDEEKLEEKQKRLKELEEKMKEFDGKFREMREAKMQLGKDELELERGLKEMNDIVAGIKFQLKEKQKKADEIQENISKLTLNRIPRFAFLNPGYRPEELHMQLIDDHIDIARIPVEELEKHYNVMRHQMAENVYSMEYQMRQNQANEPETMEQDGDGENAVLKIQILSEEELRAFTSEQLEEMQFRRKTYEHELDAMKKKVNLGVIDEYVEKLKKYNIETSIAKEINKNFDIHRTKMCILKRQRAEEFTDGFVTISKSVREVYQMLTAGGDAELVYKSGSDPFCEGIQFAVRPAKKSWKNIENLSGGEKTLASLSLVFALHTFRPTPFYVMDEIDAALDYRNVSIIANYVKERTANAQFIIISLRNNMFELANRLIGIYKVDDCTRNVAIDPLIICQRAKEIARRLGMNTNTMPEEVTEQFMRERSAAKSAQSAGEKQYQNFPSTSDIARAEKIVDIESKFRKAISRQGDRTDAGKEGSRPNTASSSRQPEVNRAPSAASSRPESRILEGMKVPNVRLVPASSATSSSTTRQSSEAPEAQPTPNSPQKNAVEPMDVEESNGTAAVIRATVNEGDDETDENQQVS